MLLNKSHKLYNTKFSCMIELIPGVDLFHPCHTGIQIYKNFGHIIAPSSL